MKGSYLKLLLKLKACPCAPFPGSPMNCNTALCPGCIAACPLLWYELSSLLFRAENYFNTGDFITYGEVDPNDPDGTNKRSIGWTNKIEGFYSNKEAKGYSGWRDDTPYQSEVLDVSNDVRTKSYRNSKYGANMPWRSNIPGR